MGCSNVSCGISRISLGGGDPCVFVPLVKATNPVGINGGSYIVSNDGVKFRYVPFALPLFGEYDDYGRIDEIKRDVNVETIEKHYDCKIQDFVNQCCFGSALRNHVPIKKLEALSPSPGGMFIHRDVYDWVSSQTFSEYNNEGVNAYTEYHLSEYVLRMVGFFKTETDPNRLVRYNKLYIHFELPTLKVWSDGNHVELELDGKKTGHSTFYMDGLVSFLESHNLTVPKSFYSLKNKTPIEVQYDEELEKLIESESFLTRGSKGDASEAICTLKFFNFFNVYDIFRFGDSTSCGTVFYDMYRSLYKDSSFRKMLIKFKTTELNMYHLNASYAPTWCGLQCGNPYATLSLASKVGEIMQRKIDGIKKEEEDE